MRTGGAFLGCRIFLFALILLSFFSVAAQTPDPLAETKKIDEELRQLEESPVGRQISENEKKLDAARDGLDKAREEARQKYFELAETPAYKDFDKRRRELWNARDKQWLQERKIIADAARDIYAARHQELKRLAAGETPAAHKLGLDVLTFPRLDGSTSTYPLSVILASRVLNVPYEWIYPEPSGSPWAPHLKIPDDLFLYDDYEFPDFKSMEFTLAASRVVAQPPQPGQERLAIMINSLLAISTSTHDAYSNLVVHKCDLNLAARAPTDDELALATKNGVTIKLQPIAKDALVFIVNVKNPVKNLTQRDLLQIYQGKLTNWTQLGGAATNLDAYWREHNSGSRELFDHFVSQGPLPEPEFSSQLYANSMAGPFNQVTEDDHGLGYSVYYYEHFMALSAFTRTIAVDGIEPNAETIASGKYPFTADVYAAYRADEPAKSPAMKLLHWLLSPEGQSVLRESGYVPVKAN